MVRLVMVRLVMIRLVMIRLARYAWQGKVGHGSLGQGTLGIKMKKGAQAPFFISYLCRIIAALKALFVQKPELLRLKIS